jgi:hypothetical protein
MAEQCGAALIELPPRRGRLAGISRELARTAREFADVVETTSQAIEDGRITAAEKSRVRREILELIGQAGRLLRSL